MNDEQRHTALQQLADVITQHRLAAPARIVLDMIAPVSFIASQLAIFMTPLTPHSRWRTYVRALDDQQSWELLQGMVDRHDC